MQAKYCIISGNRNWFGQNTRGRHCVNKAPFNRNPNISLWKNKQIQTSFHFVFNDDTRNGQSVCAISINLIAAFFKCQLTEKNIATNRMLSLSSKRETTKKRMAKQRKLIRQRNAGDENGSEKKNSSCS